MSPNERRKKYPMCTNARHRKYTNNDSHLHVLLSGKHYRLSRSSKKSPPTLGFFRKEINFIKTYKKVNKFFKLLAFSFSSKTKKA